MKSLVSIFDCSFRGGRAESAPQTRVVGGERVTMAEAHDASGQALVASVHADSVIFPHNEFSQQILDVKYPSITAPEALDANDPQETLVDPILEAGMRCARDLVQTGREHGGSRGSLSDSLAPFRFRFALSDTLCLGTEQSVRHDVLYRVSTVSDMYILVIVIVIFVDCR